MRASQAPALNYAGLLVGWLLPACQTTEALLAEPAAEPGLVAARRLIAAAPAAWQPMWEHLRSLEPPATPGLLRALRENPHGPGAQAAIHLLGELADHRAQAPLLEVLGGGGELGSEAALALGKLGDTEAIGQLRRAVDAASTPMTTRAAAAAALIRLGQATSIADFLAAVFLAASPQGQESSRRHRIPRTKTRWAHERFMIIEALRQRYDGATFGLDEDASWPAMRDATAAMLRHLRSR